MKSIKKVLAIMLVFTVLFTFMPMTVFAEDGEEFEYEDFSCSIDSDGILTWTKLTKAQNYKVIIDTNYNDSKYEVYFGEYDSRGLNLKTTVDYYVKYKELIQYESRLSIYVYALDSDGNEIASWNDDFYYKSPAKWESIPICIEANGVVSWSDPENPENLDHYGVRINGEFHNWDCTGNRIDTYELYKEFGQGYATYWVAIIGLTADGYWMAESEAITFSAYDNNPVMMLEDDYQPAYDGTYINCKPINGASYYYIWYMDRDKGREFEANTPFDVVEYMDYLKEEYDISYDYDDPYESVSIEACDTNDNVIASGFVRLAKHEHTEEIIPGKDPTCTEPGMTEGRYCTVCGKYTQVQEEIPALGHDYVSVEGTESEPTCTEPGREADCRCSRCGDFKNGQEVEPLGHNLSKVEAKAPTQTEDGNLAYWICSRCSSCFNDSEGQNPVDPEDVIIPKSESVDIVMSGKCGDDLVWTLDINGCLTITGSGEMWENRNRWIGNKDIKEVVVGSGVSTICARAFEDCDSLEKVTLSDGLMSVGDRAFVGCKSLTSIIFPDSVTHLGECMFASCYKLEEVVLPRNINEISDKLVYCCYNLKSINIPSTVTRIGKEAFVYCKELASVDIPEGVTTIEDKAFLDCNKITHLILPEGLTSLGEGVFIDCYSLVEMTIPQGISTLGDGIFQGCEALNSVVLPAGITTIGKRAFYGCCSLTDVIIPEGVIAINDETFMNCSSLTDVNIPESVERIGKEAFAKCNALTNVSIPSRVTQIGDYAFARCESVETISLTDGLTKIGLGAFSDCSNLKSISVPDTVTEIGDMAFYRCYSLESVELSANIERIGTAMFYGCQVMGDFSIPDKVTTIGAEAFRDCGYLDNINIPAGVTNIGDETVTIRGDFGTYTFSGRAFYNSGINKINIPEGVTVIPEETFYGSDIYEINLPERMNSIGKRAFYETNLDRIVIPEGIEIIPEKTFFGCYHLQNVSIPDSVKTIESNAFSGCERIESITIPENVESIAEGVFNNCERLKKIYLVRNSYADGCPEIKDEYKNYVFRSGKHLVYERIITEPNCLDSGERTLSCTRCGISWNDSMPALGHDYHKVTGTEKAATCEAPGREADKECSRCGDKIKGQVIEALGHDWGAWKVTKAATCTAKGSEKRVCKHDSSHIQTRSIAAKGHNYTTSTKKATLTANGSIVTKCTHCGDVKSSKTIYYPKTIKLSATSYTYDGKVKKPTVTVQDSKGKTISETNYTVTYPSGRKNIGSYKVSITMKGNYSGTKKLSFSIMANLSTSAAKVSVGSISNKVYSGSAFKPTPTVKAIGTSGTVVKLVKGTDYNITYSNNKLVGTATVKITGIGKYKGSVTKTFKINPKPTTLSKVTAEKGKLVVKWNKMSTQCSGYTIQYATKSDFSNASSVKVSSASTTSKTISSLKSKTKYYVRIRTYKTVSGKDYVSSWSSYKSASTPSNMTITSSKVTNLEVGDVFYATYPAPIVDGKIFFRDTLHAGTGAWVTAKVRVTNVGTGKVVRNMNDIDTHRSNTLKCNVFGSTVVKTQKYKFEVLEIVAHNDGILNEKNGLEAFVKSGSKIKFSAN